MAFVSALGGSSASWQPPVCPTGSCWWVKAQVAPHLVAMQLAPRRSATQQPALQQQVALQVALRLGRLVLLEAVRVAASAQQRWPVRPPVTSVLQPHILHDDQHKENVPPPVLVHDRLRMELRLPRLEPHDPHMSVRGDPNTAHGSNDHIGASIWLRGAGSAPGISGTG